MSAADAPSGTPFFGPLLPDQWVEMIEVCPDAVLVVDANRRIQGWKRAAETMFGYDRDQAIGQDFNLLVPEERRAERELDRLIDWNEDGGGVRELLTERRAQDGRTVMVRLSRQVLRGPAGEVLGAIAILRDVTETEGAIRRAAEALHLARLGNIASQIAHEMRNPLAGIHGAIQILTRREQADAETLEVYSAISDEVRRLDRLVADLQRFARPSASVRNRLELGAWLTELAPSWMNDGEKLSLYTQDAVHLTADPALLEELLIELVRNARDAAGEHGLEVTLRLSASPEGCVLSLSDNGPGIEATEVDSVFEPFHTIKARGSGLGLALARRHAESMDGRLEHCTTAPDSARFELSLPLA